MDIVLTDQVVLRFDRDLFIRIGAVCTISSSLIAQVDGWRKGEDHQRSVDRFAQVYGLITFSQDSSEGWGHDNEN